MSERYWEIYDDQDGDGFSTLSYINLSGETVEVAVESDLAKQVFEIRRCNGKDVEIKLYK